MSGKFRIHVLLVAGKWECDGWAVWDEGNCVALFPALHHDSFGHLQCKHVYVHIVVALVTILSPISLLLLWLA